MSQLSLPLSHDFRPQLVLGVCLGHRDIGVALTTREHLVRTQVVGLRRHAPTSRASRAVTAIGNLLTAYEPSRIALVLIDAMTGSELVAQLDGWLRDHAALRGMTVAAYRADVVRTALVPEGTRPTNRDLAHTLAERHPELQPLAPKPRPETIASENGSWTPRAPLPTPRERYFTRLFLAVGGALHDLDEELRARVLAA